MRDPADEDSHTFLVSLISRPSKILHMTESVILERLMRRRVGFTCRETSVAKGFGSSLEEALPVLLCLLELASVKFTPCVLAVLLSPAGCI